MEHVGEINSFYQTVGKGKLYAQEAPVVEDKILMHSYYPPNAAIVQSYVEDACDRLDYDGSFIYDEYPDKQEIERVCRRICEKIEQNKQMQSSEKRKDSMDWDFLGELVSTLFCQELHCRRCRRNRCRRFF